MRNEKGIDIAPKFRNFLAVVPLQVLWTLKGGLLEDGNTSPVITGVVNSINEELRVRLNRGEKGQETMMIDEIKIYPCFEKHPPKAEKYEIKSWQYARSGLEEFDIVLDSQNYLIDGYCGYLLALEHGLSHISIRYGKRQIVRAYHKQGGKLYAWELPGLLIDRVSVGDKLIVPTQRGVRVVTVAAVEEYRPEEYPGPLSTVIRKKKRAV